MDARQPLGRAGEEAAARLFRRQGFTVLDRNWRCCLGELDLVARRGGLLVFCEVKTRRSSSYGEPFEAVGPRKQARLRRLAGRWLADHRCGARHVRFDVVSVLAGGSTPRVTHLVDAF
ncbi:MAG TPA: YraN family protein [Actinomycetota bacterium]|nr:YraN family protein [Actinomycetota bacterium]